MHLGVKSGVWTLTRQRSSAESSPMPPGRLSCGSSSGCGCVPPTPAAQQPSCGVVRKWGPSRGTSPESHPPYQAASTPCGAGPSPPGSSTLWLRCRVLQGTEWEGILRKHISVLKILVFIIACLFRSRHFDFLLWEKHWGCCVCVVSPAWMVKCCFCL